MPKPKPLADDVSQYLERAAVAANEFRDDEARANLAAISTPRLAHRFEKAFYDSFRTAERRTLAVVCFALGTWVGGMYTDCCRHLAARGYPLTYPRQQRVSDPARRPASPAAAQQRVRSLRAARMSAAAGRAGVPG